MRRRRRTVPSGKPFAVRELSPPGPRRTVFCRRIFCRMAFRTADSAVRIFVVSRNLPVAGRLCFSGFVCRVSACCGCWRSVSTFAALLRLDRMGPWGPVPGFGWTPSVPDCAGLCRIVPDRRPVLRVRTVAGTGRGAFRVKEKSRPKRPALSVESSSGLRINNPATWQPHRKSSGRWHDAAPA